MEDTYTEKTQKYGWIVFLSIAMMISLIVIPFTTGWLDGIIPDEDAWGHGLFDVLQELAEDAEDAWRSVAVRGTVFATVCDIVMLIAAAYKSRTFSLVSALGGIAAMTWSMIKYIDLNDFDAVFDFENCGTTIGFWIPYILFIVCFFVAVTIPKATSENESYTEIDEEIDSDADI